MIPLDCPFDADTRTTPAAVRRALVTAAIATAIAVASSSAAAAPPQAAVSGAAAHIAPTPTDAILGWLLGAEFPDLSPYAETWASTAFPNRCVLLSPLPCG